MNAREPIVSVVTPVYNGERHLSECIESIIRQTFRDWEYVIVDNCSTDKTREIVKHYLSQDSRIRLYENEEFLELIENWNCALRHISPHSKYCKVVHADDLLFPECLEHMIALAEANPNVGVVASYVLKGTKVKCDGLTYPSPVVAGREICRRHFQGEFYLFGSPSSTLIRADLIRKTSKFYNEENYHADVEAMYEILKATDFAFVHQVLSYTRLHDESQTSTFAEQFLTTRLNGIRMIEKYGHEYLDRDEFESVNNMRLRAYYRLLARRLLEGAPKGFLRYHKQGLEQMGEKLRLGMLGIAYLKAAFRRLLGRL